MVTHGNMSSSLRIFIWVFLFSVSMAFLESAVVVYLRALYYPDGFAFPLKEMSPVLAMTELFRELATMVMLASVAAVASRRFAIAVAWFIFAFAVWDIFYYIFLYALLGWPSSLFTWDILFLLPVMWVGPVLAPVLNSLTMIGLAVLIIRASETHEKIRLKGTEWLLLATGSVVTIIGYTSDCMHFMRSRFSFIELVSFSDYREVVAYSAGYVPEHFNWWIFGVGEVLFLIAIWMVCRRYFFQKHKGLYEQSKNTKESPILRVLINNSASSVFPKKEC
jgi:hypothetical protein